MKLKDKAKIVNFLYTNIGRGHPSYLDGIIDSLRRDESSSLGWETFDVFESSSFVPSLVWKSARLLYRSGSSDSWLGRIYTRFRQSNNYNQDSLWLKLAGLTLRKRYRLGTIPLVVAHPILAGILRGRKGLIYQHGEMVAPSESLVRGAETVLVPTKTVADQFHESGYDRSQLLVTGLCIEEALVSQAAVSYESRLNRINGTGSLTAGFFSSGAEPSMHVDRLIAAAESMIKAGHRAILFVKKSGRFGKSAMGLMEKYPNQSKVVKSISAQAETTAPLTVVQYSNRDEENRLTARYFPHFDLIVAPAHERSNWALGLGLPIAIVLPCFGSFAPLNRDNLIRHGVGFELKTIAEASQLANRIESYRANGQLSQMIRSGWGEYAIDGFATITRFLTD